jgi:hypothetical protein
MTPIAQRGAVFLVDWKMTGVAVFSRRGCRDVIDKDLCAEWRLSGTGVGQVRTENVVILIGTRGRARDSVKPFTVCALPDAVLLVTEG